MNIETGSQYLIFEVDEAYGLELDKVLEIIEYTGITQVPETPDYIAGVINLRGHVVPVMDVRARFKKEPGDHLPRRCIILVSFEESTLGLIVDNVLDLIVIEEGSLSQPPQIGNDYAHNFIKLIGVYEDKMNLIVDVDKLIHLNDLSFLENDN